MPSPFALALAVFGLVVAVVLFRAFLRRGKNLLEAVAPLPGETVLAERDIRLSSMPRRRALYTTLVFQAARARVTSARLLVAQPGLFAPTKLVLRYVIHLRAAQGTDPTDWQDGFATFVLDAERSGVRQVDGVTELRLVARNDPQFVPSYVALRGEAVEELARLAGLGPLAAS